MNIIQLPGFVPARCLKPLTNETLALHGKVVVLDINGQKWAISAALMRRAAAATADQVFQAGTDMLSNYAHDKDALSPCGFTADWATGTKTNLDQMFALYKKSKDTGYIAEVSVTLGGGKSSEAQDVARQVLTLAQASGLRNVFSAKASDLVNSRGLYQALWEIDAKARVPQLRTQLMAIGVDGPLLDRVSQLWEDIQKGRTDKSQAKADSRGAMDPLTAAKALIIGDVLMVSTSARVVLTPDRARLYQVRRLLKVPSRRGKAKSPRPQGQGQVTTVPAAQGTGPSQGATAPPPQAQGTAPAPQVPGTQGTQTTQGAPQQGTASGQQGIAIPGSTPGTLWTATGVGVHPMQQHTQQEHHHGGHHHGHRKGSPVVSAQELNLTPGAVLFTIQVHGGPRLSAVVQEDGTVAWQPEGAHTRGVQPHHPQGHLAQPAPTGDKGPAA